MAYIEPTDSEIRDIFLSTPKFYWPTFEHMPLNCFDVTAGLVVFPGDIAIERARAPSYFADYQSDINDESTCPKIYEPTGAELWNEQSTTMRWFLGGIKWACNVDFGDIAVSRGFFSVGVAIIRFQNMAAITNVTNIEQLKQAIQLSLEVSIREGLVKPILKNWIFEKNINGRVWVVVRSLNALDYPVYQAVSPIDHRTAINVPATLDNCWDRDEIIPWEVEQKHLASFWDFLSQIQFIENREDALAPGSHLRETPGQAEKIPNDDFEW